MRTERIGTETNTCTYTEKRKEQRNGSVRSGSTRKEREEQQQAENRKKRVGESDLERSRSTCRSRSL